LLRPVTVGDQVKLKLFRAGGEQEAAVKADDFPLSLADGLIRRQMGLKVREERGAGERVVIEQVDPASAAGRVGLAPGDIIRQVNQTRIQGMDSFRRAVVNSRYQESVILLTQRGEYGYYITLPVQTSGGPAKAGEE
jgi:S1-C subfamily serine protease